MITVDHVRKEISTLIQSNRTLSRDLDESRQLIVELRRERDALRQQVEASREEYQRSVLLAARLECDAENLRAELASERRKVEKLGRERGHLQGDSATNGQRLRLAEQRVQLLTRRLQQAEAERDQVTGQLRGAARAMREVREALASQMGDPAADNMDFENLWSADDAVEPS